MRDPLECPVCGDMAIQAWVQMADVTEPSSEIETCLPISIMFHHVGSNGKTIRACKEMDYDLVKRERPLRTSVDNPPWRTVEELNAHLMRRRQRES